MHAFNDIKNGKVTGSIHPEIQKTGVSMLKTYSISAVLYAIPELKSVAPEHYPRLLAEAEKNSFSTQWSHWRAVFVGILVCLFYFFLPTTSSGGSFMLRTFAPAGFAWVILFFCDYFYLRILRNAVLAEMSKVM